MLVIIFSANLVDTTIILSYNLLIYLKKINKKQVYSCFAAALQNNILGGHCDIGAR